MQPVDAKIYPFVRVLVQAVDKEGLQFVYILVFVLCMHAAKHD